MLIWQPGQDLKMHWPLQQIRLLLYMLVQIQPLQSLQELLVLYTQITLRAWGQAHLQMFVLQFLKPVRQ